MVANYNTELWYQIITGELLLKRRFYILSFIFFGIYLTCFGSDIRGCLCSEGWSQCCSYLARNYMISPGQRVRQHKLFLFLMLLKLFIYNRYYGHLLLLPTQYTVPCFYLIAPQFSFREPSLPSNLGPCCCCGADSTA